MATKSKKNAKSSMQPTTEYNDSDKYTELSIKVHAEIKMLSMRLAGHVISQTADQDNYGYVADLEHVLEIIKELNKSGLSSAYIQKKIK